MTETQRRALLQVSGAVALVMGLHGVLTGTRGVAHGPRDTPFPGRADVDSEFRFFAAWYAVTGALTLREATAAEPGSGTVRIVGAGWLVAALGRVQAIRAAGRPHLMFLVLLVVEAALGVLLVASRRDPRERRSG